MPKKPSRARAIAVAATSASVALGLAACGPGAPSSTSVASGVKDMVSGSGPTALFTRIIDLSTTTSASGVEVGTGTYDSGDGSWSLLCKGYASLSTNPVYDLKVLVAKGTTYFSPYDLSTVMKSAAWVTMAGPLSQLRNTPWLQAAISPGAVADLYQAAGLKFHQFTLDAQINNKTAIGYEVTISASRAVGVIAHSGASAAEVAIATELFVGQPVTLAAYENSGGQVVSFGYNTSPTKTLIGKRVQYVVTTTKPGRAASAPTAHVVSFPTFLKAVAADTKSKGSTK